MKRLLLFFFYSLSSVCMQSPELTNQFIAAIQEANFEKVKTMLDAQPSLQKSIREYYNFTSEPILKFAVRNPELKPRYMEIARYLINRGALAHEGALQKLQEFEKLQTPTAKETTSATPTPAAIKPAQKPLSPPKPVLTPVSKPATPVAVSPAKPSGKPSAKDPAIFQELFDLVRLRIDDFNAIKGYVETHDVKSLPAIQKEQILGSILDALSASGPMTSERLHAFRRTLALLFKNGFDLKSMPQRFSTQYTKTQSGNFGPRSGYVESLLSKAVQNRDLNRVKQLVENEDTDVNALDTSGKSPLMRAVMTNSQEIADYLYSKGARILATDYERNQYRPLLQKWGIPIP